MIFNCLLIYELKLNSISYDNETNRSASIQEDLKNMTKTLILISFVFVAIIIPRSLATLFYSALNKSTGGFSLLFGLIKCIDFVYSVFFNSVFFILITRNELFSEEFKNFHLRQNPNDLNHI